MLTVGIPSALFNHKMSSNNVMFQCSETQCFLLVAVRNAGINVISSEIQQVNKQLTDAVEAFKPINATCDKLLNAAITKCGNCVESKCKAR